MKRNGKSPQWYSSYEKNNYGELFYSLMRVYQPEKVVELGTLTGYSAYHLARGLKANEKGTLDCYDLWEEYDNQNTFYSFPQSTAEENLKEFKDIIHLNLRDVIDVGDQYESIDILHVDVENNGEILERIIPHWIDKTRQIIIIEGGSVERDQEEWMLNLKKPPIVKWLEEFSSKRKDIEYFTIDPHPSVTIIRKKS